MKGKTSIIKELNEALSIELTAINQYFIHARMFQDWGYEKLGQKMYQESLGEMRHADELVKRILFLEGIPAISKYKTINVGKTVPGMLERDLKLETSGTVHYRKAIQTCLKEADGASRDLMEKILVDSEEHVDWLETQIRLIESVGLENFLAAQMEPNQA